MPTLQLDGVIKDYGREPQRVRALHGVNLAVEQGEFASIVGRSGSGKTTMLDCIGLLMRPTAGRVLFDGIDTGGLTEPRRAELRSRRIGFIFQDFDLLPTLTAMENVLLPLRYSGGDRREAGGGPGTSSRRSDSPTGSTTGPPSYRADSSSGSPSPDP